jgi:hypothetical protein
LVQRQTQLWLAIKRSLTEPNGPRYFDQSLRNMELPGGADGVEFLRGTVISSKPAVRPAELTLAIVGAANPEALLLLKAAWKEPIPTGTEVQFSGIPKTFTSDPFLLTFDVLKFEVLGPAQKARANEKQARFGDTVRR